MSPPYEEYIGNGILTQTIDWLIQQVLNFKLTFPLAIEKRAEYDIKTWQMLKYIRNTLEKGKLPKTDKAIQTFGLFYLLIQELDMNYSELEKYLQEPKQLSPTDIKKILSGIEEVIPKKLNLSYKSVTVYKLPFPIVDTSFKVSLSGGFYDPNKNIIVLCDGNLSKLREFYGVRLEKIKNLYEILSKKFNSPFYRVLFKKLFFGSNVINSMARIRDILYKNQIYSLSEIEKILLIHELIHSLGIGKALERSDFPIPPGFSVFPINVESLVNYLTFYILFKKEDSKTVLNIIKNYSDYYYEEIRNKTNVIGYLKEKINEKLKELGL